MRTSSACPDTEIASTASVCGSFGESSEANFPRVIFSKGPPDQPENVHLRGLPTCCAIWELRQTLRKNRRLEDRRSRLVEHTRKTRRQDCAVFGHLVLVPRCRPQRFSSGSSLLAVLPVPRPATSDRRGVVGPPPIRARLEAPLPPRPPAAISRAQGSSRLIAPSLAR